MCCDERLNISLGWLVWISLQLNGRSKRSKFSNRLWAQIFHDIPLVSFASPTTSFHCLDITSLNISSSPLNSGCACAFLGFWHQPPHSPWPWSTSSVLFGSLLVMNHPQLCPVSLRCGTGSVGLREGVRGVRMMYEIIYGAYTSNTHTHTHTHPHACTYTIHV